MASNLAHELWLFKRSVSLEEVTRHYRKLCKLYHPDLRSSEDRAHYERHMQEINSAYQEALKRFNIYTFHRPKKTKRPDTGGLRVGFVNKARYTPHADVASPRDARKQHSLESPIPNRLLSSALASLKLTKTFFSLKATVDLRERVHYRAALEELEALLRRFPGSREAQDAMYYSAIVYCNLKEYVQALKCFGKYRQHYPEETRNRIYHFYEGVCNHRLGRFEDAVREYGYFLLSKPPGIYSHFVALVATYKEAAEENIVPTELPYG